MQVPKGRGKGKALTLLSNSSSSNRSNDEYILVESRGGICIIEPQPQALSPIAKEKRTKHRNGPNANLQQRQEVSTAAQSPSRAAAPSSERPKRKDKPAKKLKTKKSKPCILRKPTRLGAKGSADTSKTKMNIEADSEHTISERHFTEQLLANTSSIKGRSKVRVGKRKPAKVKPTTEIVEDDRLTGITIGDSGIQNMNRLIINGLEDLSAADIWVVGKTLGAEASGDESEVIKHLQAMEDRDQLQWVRETSRQANLRNEDVWRHAK
ncbi:hypothetical protein Ancab_029573 [Ancistrocladus abbreviatus]